MADNTILPIPSTTGDTIAADDIGGVKFQRIKLTLGADGVNDADVSSANPIPVGGSITTMPDFDTPAVPVRQLPQRVVATSYAAAGSGVDATAEVLIRTGAGMAVNRTSGNLVITSGTTVSSETVIRSVESVDGRVTFSVGDTLSQRIVNNNFYREFVDVIGDGLSYNIVSAVLLDVTKTAHGFDPVASIGQRMDWCALSSVGVPQEVVIASIPDANTIRFTTVGNPASGSGTCSLTGWNKIELNFTGTTATTVTINSRRRGYQNTATSMTISTSASGSMIMCTLQNDRITFSTGTLAVGSVLTDRSVIFTNIPEPDTQFYYQIRVKNGTVAPASTTTWTCAFTRMQDFIATQVELTGLRQFGLGASLPVTVLTGSTTAVTGTVTATVTGGTTLPVTPTTTFTNSAATTNGTVIKASAGTLWSVVVSNVNAAARYLKFYNSTTVTVGTTTPAFTILIPAGATVNIAGGSNGIRFATGICLGITTGMADADTGAVAANEIKVATTFT